jgi:hypothetical protein
MVADLGNRWTMVAKPVRLLRHGTSGARDLAGRWVPLRVTLRSADPSVPGL